MREHAGGVRLEKAQADCSVAYWRGHVREGLVTGCVAWDASEGCTRFPQSRGVCDWPLRHGSIRAQILGGLPVVAL
jgi:hypothetical protein